MSDLIILSVAENIAHIELNRPTGMNALDRATADAFSVVLGKVEALSHLRAVVITGRGPAFCVGGDLAYFVERFADVVKEFDYMVGLWQDCIQRLSVLPIPVITGVHGGVGGGGLGLVWAADYVLAADNTRMATGFSAIGVSGDGGSSWYLPRLVGMRRAKQMLLGNKVIDAETALAWGLVDQLVMSDELREKALTKARKMALGSRTSVAAMKRLLAQSGQCSLKQQLESERQEMIACAHQQDIKAGMSAFLKGEKPGFSD